MRELAHAGTPVRAAEVVGQVVDEQVREDGSARNRSTTHERSCPLLKTWASAKFDRLGSASPRLAKHELTAVRVIIQVGCHRVRLLDKPERLHRLFGGQEGGQWLDAGEAAGEAVVAGVIVHLHCQGPAVRVGDMQFVTGPVDRGDTERSLHDDPS